MPTYTLPRSGAPSRISWLRSCCSCNKWQRKALSLYLRQRHKKTTSVFNRHGWWIANSTEMWRSDVFKYAGNVSTNTCYSNIVVVVMEELLFVFSKMKTAHAATLWWCAHFQDVSDRYSLHYPKLYAPGQRDLFFNKRVFALSTGEAIATSLLLFFVPYGALSDTVNAGGLDISNRTSFAFLVASILIVTVTLRVSSSDLILVDRWWIA